MAAVITCPETLKEAILTDLEDKENEFSLINIVSKLDFSEEDDLIIKETKDGMEILFPVGEIYGQTTDYVDCVTDVFSELKKKYPNIGIRGECYFYETVCAGTTGPIFYCKPSDASLTVVDRWQRCCVCGKILETDTFYNSDQWDFNEGDEKCLCCPTCMLEYAILEYGSIINPNDSFSEEESDAIFDEEITFEELFLQRIRENLDEYLPDFAKNADRVRALLDGCEDEKNRALLLEILNRINQ